MGKFLPSGTVFPVHLLQFFNLKKSHGRGTHRIRSGEEPLLRGHDSPQQGRLAYVGCDPKPRHGRAGPLRVRHVDWSTWSIILLGTADFGRKNAMWQDRKRRSLCFS